MSFLTSSSNNKYEILKKLDMSTFPIFLANSLQSNLQVAIKMFPFKPDYISIFRKELQAFLLIHPFIIKYVDLKQNYQPEDTPDLIQRFSFIVMELAPYGDLIQILGRDELLDDEKFVRTIFHYLCDVVKFLHIKNFAHLDLKFDNVLIGEDFLPKLCDFGTIFKVGQDEKLESKGTVNYRAPEIISGNCQDPFAADIYSLGVMLITLKLKFLPYVEDCLQDFNVDLQELLIDSNPNFWKSHPNVNNLSNEFIDDFKELAFGMTRKNPVKRFNFDDIKKNNWYNQEIYQRAEFIEIMMKNFENKK